MAGGIDWFRWHHGSVTDPKFQLVARKAESSLPAVLAVWAYLLEKASAADFRGCFGEIDCEAVDCLFRLDDGETDAILSQMVERKLIADEFIVAWEKRQPKKEDDTAADRKRRQRERDHDMAMAKLSPAKGVTSDESQHVTPVSRDVTLGHDREEKSREEKKEEQKTTPAPAAWVSSSELVADGLPEDLAAEWLAHRKARKAKLTALAWAGFKSEVSKAGWSVEDAVRKAIARNWTAFEAAWVAKAQSPPRNSYADQQRAQLAALTGARTHQEDVIDV